MKRTFEILKEYAAAVAAITGIITLLAGGFDWMWTTIVHPNSNVISVQLSPQQISAIVNVQPDWLIRFIADSRAAEGVAAEQTQQLAARLEVSRDAIKTFFEIIGENDVQEKDVRSKLIEIATAFVQLRNSLTYLSSLHNGTTQLFAEALDLLGRGKLLAADAKLAAAESLASDNLQTLHREKQETAAASIDLSYIQAARGDLALVKLKYDSAITHYKEAASSAANSKSVKAHYDLLIGNIYFNVWKRSGHTDDLLQSTSFYTEGFKLYDECGCDVDDFALHAFQFGSGLVSSFPDHATTGRMLEAATVLESSVAQREVRLTLPQEVTAKILQTKAYLMFLEADDVRAYDLDKLDKARRSLQSAREADMHSVSVPGTNTAELKVLLARSYVQYAKQVIAILGMSSALELYSNAIKAISEAREMKDLSKDQVAHLDFASADLGESKALRENDAAGMNAAIAGFSASYELAISTSDVELQKRAYEAELRARGELSLQRTTRQN